VQLPKTFDHRRPASFDEWGESKRREVGLYQPPEKRPRTKDDDEKDSEMTLNRNNAKHNGNFVLVDSGSFEADGAHQFIEIVYDFLIEAIQLGSLVYFEFGVSAVGLE
jgi:hypothetical protein